MRIIRKLVILADFIIDAEENIRIDSTIEIKGQGAEDATPFCDLIMLVESLGAVCKNFRNQGYTDIEGRDLKEYIHKWIDNACNDDDTITQKRLH